ncbi:MAG: T9SS type A sorting domain-containing protein [Bacteroidota bacterium]
MLATTRALLCALALLLALPATAQTETLLRPASNTNDQFAYNLDLDGDRLLVGRPYDDTAGPEAGAALVYDYANGAWALSATLLPPTTTGFELAGTAVALDGDRAVLGGYLKDNYTGIAYVYERTGTAWALTATLTPSDASAGQGFGYSLALDGDRLAISALGDDTGATDAGAVYVFDYANGAWSETVKLTAAVPKQAATLGLAVDVNGNRVIAGAPIGVTTAGDGGAAHVFTETTSGWTEAVLQAADQNPGDRFGQSVALDGPRAVVGAYYHDAVDFQAGAAYVFDLAGTTWTESAKLLGSVTHEYQQVGSSVDVAGDRVVVGAPSSTIRSEPGIAYVYDLDGTWQETFRLSASDGLLGDYHGFVVALSGSRVAVGAPFTDTGAAMSGTAYVYDTDGAFPMPSFVAADAITVARANALVGGLASNGSITLRKQANGYSGSYDTDVTATGAVTVDKRNAIEGDVTAGGLLTVGAGATVAGTAQGNAAVAPFALPSVGPFAPGTQNETIQAGETRTLTPGSYQRVRVKGEGTLILLGSAYTFDELLVNRNATLILDVANGPMTLNVATRFNIGADVEVRLVSFGGANPLLSGSVTLNTTQTATLNIGARSNFIGTINAPSALVSVRGDASFRGAIAAREIKVSSRTAVVRHGTPVAAPSSIMAPSSVLVSAGASADALPDVLGLDAYPNPVATSATLRFTLPEAGDVDLRVYDLLGRVVAEVATGALEAGTHTVPFDASALPSGVYVVRLQTPRGGVTQRLTRVR